jgi:hypothetical protein
MDVYADYVYACEIISMRVRSATDRVLFAELASLGRRQAASNGEPKTLVPESVLMAIFDWLSHQLHTRCREFPEIGEQASEMLSSSECPPDKLRDLVRAFFAMTLDRLNAQYQLFEAEWLTKLVDTLTRVFVDIAHTMGDYWGDLVSACRLILSNLRSVSHHPMEAAA